MGLQGAGGEEWQTFEFIGEQTDAESWRSVADGSDSAIAIHRQRDARWRLLDRFGKPLSHQQVEIVQKKSTFSWGMNSWGWMNASQAGRFDLNPMRHSQELWLQLVNSIVLLHYWAETTPTDAPISEEYQGEISYDHLDKILTWCQAHGLQCKGHPLFWQVPKALPKWLLKYDLETRWKFVEVRLRQITSRFKGRITSYDLSNEMMWEPVLAHTEERHWPHIEDINVIADDHAKMMGWVREEDPDACFLLNEYGLLAGSHDAMPVKTNSGGEISRHQQLGRFVQLGHAMIERGQAPNAMGLQTTSGEWNGLEAFGKTIDAIASTNLPVHITEYRPNAKAIAHVEDPAEREALLGDYIEATVRTCFAKPAVEAFYFWDLGSFINGRKPTSIYTRMHDLIKKQWMTATTVTTDSDGYCQFRGFHGDYSIRLPRQTGSSGYAASLKAGFGTDEQQVVVDYLASPAATAK
jgi:GH35 family endo-1,4-beta-xylanase